MEENFDRSKVMDFAFLIEALYFYSDLLGRTVSSALRRFIENMQGADLIHAISDNLEDHPMLRHLVLATALICAIPVVIFLMFAVFSMVITFTGFLFIEGTILAVGGLSMFICLLSLIMAMSILALSLGTVYLLAMKCGVFLTKLEPTSSFLRNYVPRLNDNEILELSSSGEE